MRFARGRAIVLGMTTAILVGGPGQSASRAQLGAAGPVRAPVVGGSGPLLRPAAIMDQGWAEVLTVTSKWLVIQNDQGQQFPISFDAIQLFIARWPLQIGRIPAGSLVEATGPDTGNSALLTSHVDVYSGGARSMVTPTFLYINANGQLSRQIDFTFNPGVYGDLYPGIGSPIQGNVLAGPTQIHVVGPPTSLAPLSLNTPGNSAIGILPATPGGISATQITPGTSSILRPGDIVYFVSSGIGVKSLALSQLIVYKQVEAP